MDIKRQQPSSWQTYLYAFMAICVVAYCCFGMQRVCQKRGEGQGTAAILPEPWTCTIVLACQSHDRLLFWHAEGPSEEGSRGGGQEEAAIFSGDTSFMQGAVGLTLMPPASGDRVPLKDLAALSCFLFGTDKSYGLFMSVSLCPCRWQASLCSLAHAGPSSRSLVGCICHNFSNHCVDMGARQSSMQQPSCTYGLHMPHLQ